MNALLIHNDNLPSKTIESFQHRLPFKISTQEMLEFSFSLDNKIVEILENELNGKKYDVIFLPYSLSDNYIEYTSLRIVLHLRLTKKWNHQNCPIVFIGVDRIEEVAKLTNYGGFLFTSGIFATKKFDYKLLENQYRWIITNKPFLSEDEYYSFLEKIIIRASANYTSHHSITNEWGILRWTEMSDAPKETKEEVFSKIKIKDTLYFKYLTAKIEREKNKKKKFKDLSINKVDNVKVYYIDDEVGKGWGVLFKKIIFKDYGSVFDYFNDFNKEDSRTQLLDKLEKEVKLKIKQGFNLFIVDLRLCDEDFSEDDNSKFTGIQIIDIIKKINPGIQVLIFTASNKSANAKLCFEKDVSAYIEKENPLLGLDKDKSYKLYLDFFYAFEKASKSIFLFSLYNKISYLESSFLKEIVDDDNLYNARIKERLMMFFGLRKKSLEQTKFEEAIYHFSANELAFMTLWSILNDIQEVFYDKKENSFSNKVKDWNIKNQNDYLLKLSRSRNVKKEVIYHTPIRFEENYKIIGYKNSFKGVARSIGDQIAYLILVKDEFKILNKSSQEIMLSNLFELKEYRNKLYLTHGNDISSGFHKKTEQQKRQDTNIEENIEKLFSLVHFLLTGKEEEIL